MEKDAELELGAPGKCAGSALIRRHFDGPDEFRVFRDAPDS
jgi:hypothetical protein